MAFIRRVTVEMGEDFDIYSREEVVLTEYSRVEGTYIIHILSR